MYTASPDAKVILTVRDDEEEWVNSWIKFVRVEHERKNLFGISTMKIQSFLAEYGYMGQELKDKFELQSVQFCDFIEHFTDVLNPASFFIDTTIKTVEKKREKLKNMYTAHNEHVINSVPKDNLLIWNVKDGWEPVCSFLGVEQPNEPFPHDNKTGDGFMERYAWETGFVKKIQQDCLRKTDLKIIKF